MWVARGCQGACAAWCGVGVGGCVGREVMYTEGSMEGLSCKGPCAIAQAFLGPAAGSRSTSGNPDTHA